MLIPEIPYLPWRVSEQDFPRNGSVENQLRFLVRYAILAPSSHNTQPWRFSIEKNIIKIYPDFDRSLQYADRTNREMYISLGCALGNLIIASYYFGFAPKIEYLPEDDLTDPAVKVSLISKEMNSKLKEIFLYITKRTTNRMEYLTKTIPEKVLKQIISYNDEPDIKAYFVSNNEDKKRIVEMVVEASTFAFKDSIFKDELSHWVTSVYTKRVDGIALFGFGMPHLLTIFAPMMIKNMPAKIQAGLDKKMMTTAASFIILTTKENTKEYWVKAGKIYEFLTLACLKEGVATAPWAGIVEYETTNKKLKGLLKTHDVPLFFARMGYALKQPHLSPRRPLEDVLS